MIATSTISPALKIGLQLLGVWPGVSHFVYFLIYMPSTLIIQYFQYLYVTSHFKLSELSDLVDSLPASLNYSLSFIKFINLWIHRRVIHNILVTMDNDWRECINIDQHLYLMTIKANVSHFYSNVMLSLNAIASVIYLFGDYAIRFLRPVDNYNHTSRQLPMKIQLPFETDQSMNFVLTDVALSIHVLLNICMISILNILIFSVVLHASGQIEIICQELRTISEKNSFYGASAFKLGILIERHNRVISFSDNIEKLFSFMAMMQIIWNTLVICWLGFVIIISIYNEGSVTILVRSIFSGIVIMMEAFIICFAGEYLSLKSKSIAEAAYESLWYDMPPNQVKVTSLIIMRSQKPLAITAGKFTNLSLECFANIMKASMSYISVLYAMY